jgi:6-pyruvoyltetrahydropterin/6-carboxytetrahydropterin synthase
MLISRKAEFSASHRCYNPALSEQQNLELYGETAASHGHGHNYVLEVTIDGQPDPVTGMIFDLKELKDIVNREVIEPMDHRHLNYEVKPFDSVVPTAENLAIEIWRRLEPQLLLPNARLRRIRLYETEDLFVEYSGEHAG